MLEQCRNPHMSTSVNQATKSTDDYHFWPSPLARASVTVQSAGALWMPRCARPALMVSLSECSGLSSTARLQFDFWKTCNLLYPLFSNIRLVNLRIEERNSDLARTDLNSGLLI